MTHHKIVCCGTVSPDTAHGISLLPCVCHNECLLTSGVSWQDECDFTTLMCMKHLLACALFRMRRSPAVMFSSSCVPCVRGSVDCDSPWHRRVRRHRPKPYHREKRSRPRSGWKKRTNGCCKNKVGWHGHRMAVCHLLKNGWKKDIVWGNCLQ